MTLTSTVVAPTTTAAPSGDEDRDEEEPDEKAPKRHRSITKSAATKAKAHASGAAAAPNTSEVRTVVDIDLDLVLISSFVFRCIAVRSQIPTSLGVAGFPIETSEALDKFLSEGIVQIEAVLAQVGTLTDVIPSINCAVSVWNFEMTPASSELASKINDAMFEQVESVKAAFVSTVSKDSRVNNQTLRAPRSRRLIHTAVPPCD